jgi:hypothetical protein
MSRSGLVWGTLFVLVGVFTLMVDLDVWQARLDWMWPLLLLGLGAALILGGLLPTRGGDGSGG